MLHVTLEKETLQIKTSNRTWSSVIEGDSYVQFEDDSILNFRDFPSIVRTHYESGTFEGFYVDYTNDEIAIRTFYLVDGTTEELTLTLHVLKEQRMIKEIKWPSSFVLHEGAVVLPYRQGILLPYEDKRPLDLPFHGQFCSAAAYVQMIGFIASNESCLMIADTPYDMAYNVSNEHHEVSLLHLPSLGHFYHERKIRYVFLETTDYNDLASYYRKDCKMKGNVVSLNQKAVVLPQIKTMAQMSLVHCGIQTYVQKESRFFDPLNPEKNNHLTSFSTRLEEMKSYKAMGMDHLYLHLDGWGVAYDNQHPDVMPINPKAGGPQAMKSLVDGLHDLGYMFGVHDQYRDYYYNAPSYNEEFAVEDIHHQRYSHNFWAGGYQNYLCATQAKDYVRRNFTLLKNQGITLDGAYLDVFTCNELDECANINHPMTRYECMRYRKLCFDYLIAQGIMTSSEEVNEWAIPSLVFCHYAPYEFQMHEDGQYAGIGIPLFNLIYHDCVMIPWMMDRPDDDYMLYALLNGGMPYFRRDAAYPNIDGAFTKGVVSLEEQKDRCKIVSTLFQKVYNQPMVRHELLDKMGRKQQTTFANGITVSINLDSGVYEIKGVDE